MKLETYELKCPVCGTKNVPVELTMEMGIGGPKVGASYQCAAWTKRPFRPAKPCRTRYKIELCGAEAVRALYGDKGGTNCGI